MWWSGNLTYKVRRSLSQSMWLNSIATELQFMTVECLLIPGTHAFGSVFSSSNLQSYSTMATIKLTSFGGPLLFIEFHTFWSSSHLINNSAPIGSGFERSWAYVNHYCASIELTSGRCCESQQLYWLKMFQLVHFIICCQIVICSFNCIGYLSIRLHDVMTHCSRFTMWYPKYHQTLKTIHTANKFSWKKWLGSGTYMYPK